MQREGCHCRIDESEVMVVLSDLRTCRALMLAIGCVSRFCSYSDFLEWFRMPAGICRDLTSTRLRELLKRREKDLPGQLVNTVLPGDNPHRRPQDQRHGRRSNHSAHWTPRRNQLHVQQRKLQRPRPQDPAKFLSRHINGEISMACNANSGGLPRYMAWSICCF